MKRQLAALTLLVLLAPGVYAMNNGEALTGAASRDDVGQVRTLLSQGLDVNSKDRSGYASLNWAAWCGSEEMAELLLGNQLIEVNSKDWWGITALHEAALGGHTKVVKLLLGDKRIEVDIKDNAGLTPLCVAVSNGYARVVKALMEYGEGQG